MGLKFLMDFLPYNNISISKPSFIEKDYFNSGRIITSNSAKILLQFESKIS